MLTFANVVNLFSNKFPGLCGGRLPLTLIFLHPLERLFIWHRLLLLPNIAVKYLSQQYGNSCNGGEKTLFSIERRHVLIALIDLG